MGLTSGFRFHNCQINTTAVIETGIRAIFGYGVGSPKKQNWSGRMRRGSEMAEQQQPQLGEVWRHKSGRGECLFIGRSRDGQMVWQCDGDTVEIGDIDWHGWERVHVAVPHIKPGWIVKDCHGLWWTDETPFFDENQWQSAACNRRAADWQVMRCIADPWPDQPDGGPDCILQIH
jgi:hypothetical protein